MAAAGAEASMGFGELLRRHRDGRRWSQVRLADEADIDYSQVSRLESGARAPTLSIALKVASGLRLLPAERDALLLAAGYRPIDPVSILGDEPLVASLYRVLRDESIPQERRESLRMALAGLTRLARAWV